MLGLSLDPHHGRSIQFPFIMDPSIRSCLWWIQQISNHKRSVNHNAWWVHKFRCRHWSSINHPEVVASLSNSCSRWGFQLKKSHTHGKSNNFSIMVGSSSIPSHKFHPNIIMAAIKYMDNIPTTNIKNSAITYTIMFQQYISFIPHQVNSTHF